MPTDPIEVCGCSVYVVVHADLLGFKTVVCIINSSDILEKKI